MAYDDNGYTRIPTYEDGSDVTGPGRGGFMDDEEPDSRSSSSRKSKKDKDKSPARSAREGRPSTPGSRKSTKKRKIEEAAKARIERWVEMAEKGELCAYTCLGLSIGHRQCSRRVLEMMPTLVALLCLQVCVPILLLVSEMRHFQMFTKVQTHEFRIIGFILYLYSIRNMYHGALDECRTSFLDLAFQYNLSWGYIWPMLLGEVVSSFAAFTLSVTLFAVFCNSLYPQDLIINCIAINFIGSVDSEFTDDIMMKRALRIFHELMDNVKGKEVEKESWGRNIVEFLATYMLLLLRVGGTLCLGFLLAVLFAISHEEGVCEANALLCVEALCTKVPLLCMGDEE